jgi:glycosyltransferase involved in cell wall biosynthesis
MSTPLPVLKTPVPGEYLLYVGTIDHPGKNGIALVKAYNHLPQELKDCLYVVYAGKPGTGFDNIEREIERSGIKDRVTFLGFVPEDSLAELYANCKVFIFPSLYEGFGLPVLEAMMFGAPVITARNSSLIEAAGEAAILVDADDIEGMARAIERVCRDETYRRRLIALGKEHSAKFSWGTGTNHWMGLINSLGVMTQQNRAK